MRAEGERSASMSSPCHSLDQVVAEILQIVAEDKTSSCRSDDRAEYFFRGEKCNYKHPGSPVLDSTFDSCIDRLPAHWKHERELYEEAMRLNVASFTEDRTMCERLARMQHYRLPTRFADLSVNAFLSTLFACGGCGDKTWCDNPEKPELDEQEPIPPISTIKVKDIRVF